MRVTPPSPYSEPPPPDDNNPDSGPAPSKKFPLGQKQKVKDDNESKKESKTQEKDETKTQGKDSASQQQKQTKKETKEGTAQREANLMQGVVAGQQQKSDMDVGTAAATAKGGGAMSPVDKIIQVFNDTNFFGSTKVNSIAVTGTENETNITVMLNNRIEVEVILSPGDNLNITIRGLTAAAQAAADNPEQQMLLQHKLADQGFNVQQMTTYRSETAPFKSEPHGAHEERGGRGGQEGGEQEEEGPQR